MKRISLLIVSAIVFAGMMVSCSENSGPAVSKENVALSDEELIKKGEYLVNTVGCHDCHSPKRMGAQGLEIIPELMLSGYPGNRPIQKVDMSALNPGWGYLNEDLTSFIGPWGQSFAANLTSDPTGIGTWTEKQFTTALKKGWFKGIENTRMLLPPMPWQNFVNMKDEDVHAIYLYLKSTPPVQNVVPAPIAPADL